MGFDEITAVAQANDCTVVVYSMVEADRTLYSWTITASGEMLFKEVNIEELLGAKDTSLSQAVRQLYETMASAAKASLCRGPRDNREEDEEGEAPAAPDANAEIAELKHLYAALIEPIKG